MQNSLYIRLLGGFFLTVDEKVVEGIITRRMQSLIAYLLLHREAPVSRQQLAYLFWPDTSDNQARANLRHLLHNLRNTIPNAELWIKLDNQTIQWRTDSLFSMDVDEFECSSAQNDSIQALQKAVQLYAGDLLPDCYDDWIELNRERLRQGFITSLEKLVLLLENNREYDSAIQFAQLLLQHDSLHESTYRRLMRLYAIKGDRSGALRVYHSCTTTLQRELNVEPGPETQKAFQQLMNLDDQAYEPPARITSYISLIGRKSEWALMQTTWRNTRVEYPRMILISGEAGIGKSRLAEELFEWAHRQGIQTARSYCFAAQKELAYAPIVTLLRSLKIPSLDTLWLSEVSRLLPELLVENPQVPPPEPMKEDWQRLRLFEALARFMLGNPGTYFFFWEDLQFCDRETIEFLHYLLNLPLSRPDIIKRRKLILLGTLRVEEENNNPPLMELLFTLGEGERLIEIPLSPLDECETNLLANSVSSTDIDPEASRKLYLDTEGNPLFIVETVRAGLPEGLPPKVQAVIKARLSQISSLGHDLVELAAVIGREFSFRVLAEAGDWDEENLVRGLDELWQRHILREQGSEGYNFSHDKIREVVYTSLSSARRRLLHRKIGYTLETIHKGALEEVSGQIGNHFELAGMPEEAISYYRKAAETARIMFANSQAIHFLKRCLTLRNNLELGSVELKKMFAEIYESLGDLFALTAEYINAREAFQNASHNLAEIDMIGKACLQRKIGNIWREQGKFEQALDIYKLTGSMLASIPDHDSAQWWQEWIQVKLEQMLTHYWLNHPDQIQDLLDETGPIVEQKGTKIQQANYYLAYNRLDLRRQRYRVSEQTVARQRLATQLIQESGSTTEIASHHFTLGFDLLWSGNLVEAEEVLQLALALAEKTGDRQLQTRCLTYLTTVFRMQRSPEAVGEFAARNLSIAMETNLPEYAFSAMANQVWLAWREGNLEEAEGLALEALDRLTLRKEKYMFKWLALFPLIDIMIKKRQLKKSFEFAREIVDPDQQLLPDDLNWELEEAVKDWETGFTDQAVDRLIGVVSLASRYRFL